MDFIAIVTNTKISNCSLFGKHANILIWPLNRLGKDKSQRFLRK